jgi:hypothetical protein
MGLGIDRRNFFECRLAALRSDYGIAVAQILICFDVGEASAIPRIRIQRYEHSQSLRFLWVGQTTASMKLNFAVGSIEKLKEWKNHWIP